MHMASSLCLLVLDSVSSPSCIVDLTMGIQYLEFHNKVRESCIVRSLCGTVWNTKFLGSLVEVSSELILKIFFY